jgi:hypothetical protein
MWGCYEDHIEHLNFNVCGCSVGTKNRCKGIKWIIYTLLLASTLSCDSDVDLTKLFTFDVLLAS